jgi:uncharacterized membrane protein
VPWLILFLYILALAVWLGEVVFFSFVVAPQVFSNLPAEQAGAVVGLIFPTYYLLGHLCAVTVLGCALVLRNWSRPGGGLWLAAAAIAGLGLVASLYSGFVVQPRASELRPQLHQAETEAAVKSEFDDLHRLAVQLNGGILVATLVLAGLLATQLSGGVQMRRKAPRRTSDLQW